ncbi:Dapper-like protein 1 [Oryzias melastigma]|uniref:Dapper-like protein 1 n=1 Tax=Oryzias melastigma TaxID=30732 RepID=A0A834C7B8_ORYME|nr:Dapper-like protein 1 [Oryzias melastigma]
MWFQRPGAASTNASECKDKVYQVSQKQPNKGGQRALYQSSPVSGSPLRPRNQEDQRKEEGVTSAKLCKVGSKNVKAAKVKTSLMSETSVVQSERRHEKSRHRSSSRRFQYLEDGGSAHTEVYTRGTSARNKSVPVSLPEDPEELLTPFRTQAAVLSHRHRGNRHRRSRHLHDQVIVAGKPKHSRHNYRRLHSISENQNCTAKRRSGQPQREEGQSARTCPASKGQQSRPYPRAAESDSEYSAECVSLFHSTIADTSEDENSDYTANRFGDSECSGGEAEDSTTDTEESAGAGATTGRRLGQFGAAGVGGQAQMKTLRSSVPAFPSALQNLSSEASLLTSVHAIIMKGQASAFAAEPAGVVKSCRKSEQA